MLELDKTFFAIPHEDLPPGCVRLGTIIAHPHRIFAPLFHISAASAGGEYDQSINIDTQIKTRFSRCFGVEATANVDSESGVISRFLRRLGHMPALNAKKYIYHYSISNFWTKWFEPSTNMLQRIAAEDPNVKRYVKETNRRGRMFMITGVMVAELDGVSTETQMRHIRLMTANTFSSEVLFGYQLLEIRVRKNGTIKTKPFVDGALLSIENVTRSWPAIPSTEP